MEDKRNDVYQVTQKIIYILKAQEDMANGKAALAALRHSIGKSLGDAPAVWPLLLENMPEEFLSVNGRETKEERAIYAALQLYAMQKQGRRGKEKTDTVKNIGEALQKFRIGNGQAALDRRFVATLSAISFDIFLYQLRQLMQLAKAKGALPLDFAALANDLYWYQMGFQKKICLRWAEAYYRTEKKAKKSNRI